VHDRPLRLAVAVVLLAAGCSAAPPLARDADTPHEHLTVADGAVPPLFYFSVRHSLGATLLEAGRPAAAEAVYREDLRRNPENGWSLFGLAASLRAQGKTADAEAADRRFQRAWSRAAVTLPASRF
jgi:tetratricopeptide (TPR) repeat protein